MRYEAVQHQAKDLFKIHRCKVRTSVQIPRNIWNRVQELTLFTSLWKPIRGPVYDFPLTVCDRRTVDYASQTTAMDIVTRDYLNENTRIYFDEKHKWYYWHGLQVDEVIAFVQADSQAENRAGVPHTAFRDTRNKNEQLRESIEARLFVYFDWMFWIWSQVAMYRCQLFESLNPTLVALWNGLLKGAAPYSFVVYVPAFNFIEYSVSWFYIFWLVLKNHTDLI